MAEYIEREALQAALVRKRCGKQEFYDACNGYYRLIWMFLSLDSPDREIVRAVVERLAAAREEAST